MGVATEAEGHHHSAPNEKSGVEPLMRWLCLPKAAVNLVRNVLLLSRSPLCKTTLLCPFGGLLLLPLLNLQYRVPSIRVVFAFVECTNQPIDVKSWNIHHVLFAHVVTDNISEHGL